MENLGQFCVEINSELSNIDRDNIQYRPLFGHEHEFGDPSWRAVP